MDVAGWAARRFGLALSLSVPFMLKERDKRDDLLRQPPQLSLFAAYAVGFADAYIRLHQGDGFRADLIRDADALQRQHSQWMKRLRIARQRGHDTLPVDAQTVGEVLDHATPDDPVVAHAMAERAALQTIARATRGDGPARDRRADGAIRTERARLRVIEGTATREGLAQDMGLPIYSDDPDDDYNDGH